MNPLTFLAIPLVIVTVGSLWLWTRARRPQTLSSGIDDFQREMRALSPDNDRYRPRPGRTGDPRSGDGRT